MLNIIIMRNFENETAASVTLFWSIPEFLPLPIPVTENVALEVVL